MRRAQASFAAGSEEGHPIRPSRDLDPSDHCGQIRRYDRQLLHSAASSW